MRWRGTIFATYLAASAFGLAACATRPENVILPVAARAPGASGVDMIVATTRRSVDTPGEYYSGDRGGKLTFANIVVSIPPDSVRKIGEVEWPASTPGNPETDALAWPSGVSPSSKRGGARRQIVIPCGILRPN